VVDGGSTRSERLLGKRALVTGGASGIGRASALRMAEEGAALAIADIDAARGDAVRDELRAAGHEAHAFLADAGDEAAVAALLAGIERELGGLDILVNAAGQPSAYDEGTYSEIWRRGLDQTLTSVMLVSRAALPLLARDGGGSIVNISSIAGLGGMPTGTWYAVAKAGVLSLTRSMAIELGPQGVRVNAICPGLTETPRVAHLWDNPEVRDGFIEGTPLRKLGHAEDIAEAVLFFASDETAGHVTGAHLVVDGGASAGI
jgi:NAD(P)-dependent dehydrogenase (short-subunit alcohol dehydrogenase family)